MQTMLADVGEHLQPLLGNTARRAWAVLTSPKTAWPILAGEQSDLARLFLCYVVPLSAIPPLAKLIGWSLLSSYEEWSAGVAGALLSYVLGLMGIAVLSFFAGKLAAVYQGDDDFGQAAKLVAYAATASWVGGVFRLVPVLSILSLVAALYGGYLLYTGAPSVLSVPEDRAPGYTLLVAVAAVLLFLLSSMILAATVGITALGMI